MRVSNETTGTNNDTTSSNDTTIIFSGGLRRPDNIEACVGLFRDAWQCGDCKVARDFCGGKRAKKRRRVALNVSDVFEGDRCVPVDGPAFYGWCRRERTISNATDTERAAVRCTNNCFYDLWYGGSLDINYEEICKGANVTHKGTILNGLNATSNRIINETCAKYSNTNAPAFPTYAIVIIALAALVAVITIGAIIWNSRQKDRWHRISNIGSGISGISSDYNAVVTPSSAMPILRSANVRVPSMVSAVPAVSRGHSHPSAALAPSTLRSGRVASRVARPSYRTSSSTSSQKSRSNSRSASGGRSNR